MIAYVTGKLTSKQPAEALVEAGGLGYSILIPTSTFERLPALGESVTLQTVHYVRDDAVKLFGFATVSERSFFQLMIGVSGVGPMLALAALSALSPAELQQCILEGNSQALIRVRGIGRKTAERLVLELRDRVTSLLETEAPRTGRMQERADALAGLVSLGLTQAQAERRLRVVQRKHPEAATASELIRLALSE